MNLIIRLKQKRTEQLLKKLDEKLSKLKDPCEYDDFFNNPYLNTEVKYHKRICRLWWPEYIDIQPEVIRIAKSEGLLDDKGCSTRMGACHAIWAIERKLMKEKYGIIWYSKPELNPGVMYD
jgi:hypothetical protein